MNLGTNPRFGESAPMLTNEQFLAKNCPDVFALCQDIALNLGTALKTDAEVQKQYQDLLKSSVFAIQDDIRNYGTVEATCSRTLLALEQNSGEYSEKIQNYTREAGEGYAIGTSPETEIV